ncbi:MAG TPA: helix-turn-helix domain-containing protein [Gaiellaceae bacterium]|nr:helix-turn-helix domain-containing protein [Gaiellaceae bacterium]
MSHDDNPVRKDVMSSPQESAGIPPRPSPDQPAAEARERILRTAYELFHRDGVTAVGVDRIVAKAGVAKTTLYRHFRSKDDLVAAVLERHEELWTSGWLELEVERRATSPQERLPVTFEVLDEWLRGDGYEGCLFTNSLLETHGRSELIRVGSVAALENVHALMMRFAKDAGVRDPVGFAHQIHILMRGAIVAAVEGQLEAVDQARLLVRRLWEQERSLA